MRTLRPTGAGFIGALVLTAALIPFGAETGADEPKPAPSPAPRDTAAPAPGATGAADGKGGPAGSLSAPAARTARRVFGTIMGTIFDTKKKPLAGWMVQLSSRGEDSLLRITGTDEKGQYVFKDLPAGTYDIAVETENEASRRKGRIEVKPPFRNIVDFQIGPQPPDKPDPLAERTAQARKTAAEAGSAPDSATGPAGNAAGTAAPDGVAAAVEAARQVPVRGTFLDAQKRPVSEVSVTLVPLAGKGTFQTFSGDDGSFALPAVPPGRYRVLIVSPGYVPIDIKSVEVSPANGLSLSLALVDYPLNTKERPEERLPREEPVPAPSPAPTSRPS